MTIEAQPTAAWCSDPSVAAAVADLFVAHADPSYISHSELQFGRASEVGVWAADLNQRIKRDVVRATGPARDVLAGTRLATLCRGERLLGFAFVSFTTGAVTLYATLEDLMIVPEERGNGSGALLLDWIVRECRSSGMQRLFLESGRDNHRAHEFFERQRFTQTSIVMVRDL